MPTDSISVKVPKTRGERILSLTSKLGIRNKELEIEKNKNSLYIPLNRHPSETELTTLKTTAPDLQLATCSFSEKKKKTKTLAELLSGQLPPNLVNKLPRAIDIIGRIAIVEIPQELKDYTRIIGENLLKMHRNIRTVLAKAGAVRGTYRLRELIVIAGEPRTDTIHKEHDCKYHVDVAKVYFSPRLSHEHSRVASLVRNGETVVDLFAGIGPFSILIAKGNATVRVHSIDINPIAIELLKRNIRLNRVENRVFPILCNARQVFENKLLGVADRVIMNLPEKAIEFVDTACKLIKPTGGKIHFYGFNRLPNSIENMQAQFTEAVVKADRKVDRFLFSKIVRETAPYEGQVVLDALIV